MPEILLAPGPAPRLRMPRRRPTILLPMVVVALAAVALGAIRYRWAAEARTRREQLEARLARAEALIARSQEGQRKWHASAAQVARYRVAAARAGAAMRAFEGR